MKILIVVEKKFGSTGNLQKVLMMEKINSELFILTESITLKDLMGKISEYEFVLFYRYSSELDLILKNFPAKNWSFVIERFDQVKLSGSFNENLNIKFYYLPINYNLLITDLKSQLILRNLKNEEILVHGDFSLDLSTRILRSGSKSVFLKNKEFEIMKFFLLNKNRVLSRMNLLEQVWDINASVSTNTVDVHMSRLRLKIKKEFQISDMIKTIPCIGYMLV